MILCSFPLVTGHMILVSRTFYSACAPTTSTAYVVLQVSLVGGAMGRRARLRRQKKDRMWKGKGTGKVLDTEFRLTSMWIIHRTGMQCGIYSERVRRVASHTLWSGFAAPFRNREYCVPTVRPMRPYILVYLHLDVHCLCKCLLPSW